MLADYFIKKSFPVESNYTYGIAFKIVPAQTAVWSDLAKFCHFCKILKALGNFLEVLISRRQNFVTTLAIFIAIGHVYIVVNGQILETYLVILGQRLQFLSKKVWLQRNWNRHFYDFLLNDWYCKRSSLLLWQTKSLLSSEATALPTAQ